MKWLGVMGVEESVTISPECLEPHAHLGRTLYHTRLPPSIIREGNKKWIKSKRRMHDGAVTEARGVGDGHGMVKERAESLACVFRISRVLASSAE